VLALAAGAGLAMAFPQVNWSAGAWVALTPLFALALTGSPRAALAWGWLTGTVFFVVLLRWLDFTLRAYSAIPWPLTWVPIALLGAYCGLWVGAVGGVISLVARRSGPGWALATAPVAWVAGEWGRGVLFGGFPWGLLGYSQYRALPVIQVAELGGVWAVSLVVAAVNAALAGLVLLGPRRALGGLATAGALLLGTLAFGWWRLGEPSPPGEVLVAVVQPAIEQPLKFDPDHRAETFAIYTALTRAAARERPALVVWPETASPVVLRRDPAALEWLRGLSRETETPLLVGSLDVGDAGELRNSAFLLSAAGIAARYDKMQLVPFGEYVPLPGIIGFVRGWAEFISEMTPGAQPTVVAGPPGPFGVVICYEGIFPALVRRFVAGGARLLVNMTNDAWFGRTSGPWQHLAAYPFRAVEHRSAVVRSANTGVSAVIAPTGRILRTLGLFRRGVLLERVPLRARTTLYSRWGDWVAWLSVGATAAAVGASLRRSG
jgi:apolipoprotein N-acyltransferase